MPETSKENAATILERAKLENWVLGTTKVSQINKSQICETGRYLSHCKCYASADPQRHFAHFIEKSLIDKK